MLPRRLGAGEGEPPLTGVPPSLPLLRLRRRRVSLGDGDAGCSIGLTPDSELRLGGRAAIFSELGLRPLILCKVNAGEGDIRPLDASSAGTSELKLWRLRRGGSAISVSASMLLVG